MTVEMQIAEVLRIGILLLLLWAFLHWCVRDYRTEVFRQRLFEIRDRLFDAAAAGAIAFDHPAYGMVRQMINGFVRFGHRLNTTRVVTLMIMLWVYPSLRRRDFDARLAKACASLPTDDAKALIRTVHLQVMGVVLRHLICGSPLFFPSVLVILVCLVIKNDILAYRSLFEQYTHHASEWDVMREIEQEAERYGITA
jgi:hypothetical protein